MQTMKKYLIIIIIASVCLLSAVAVAIVLGNRQTDVEPEDSGDSTETSEPPFDGVTMTMFASANSTLPFDLHAYMKEDGAYFFLPADVKTGSVSFTAYDREGNVVGEFTADFSKKTSQNFDLPNQRIKVTVMQTDIPSLSILTGSGYGTTLADVVADKAQKTVCYGDAVIYVPTEYAAEYFYSDQYKTKETDPDTPGSIRISGRGHSSWMYMEKKSFTLKAESGFAPLGMEGDKNWVLVSCHYDRSLVRNSVILDIYKQFASGWSVDYREVELYVDGVYQGMYLLAEKVEIDSDKIDITDLEEQNELLNGTETPGKYEIAELECGATVKYYPSLQSPDDVTGGYLLEVEIATRAKKSASYIKTSRDFYYNIKSPEYVSYEEAVYIAEFIQNFEDALYSSDGCDTNGKHFSEYADMESIALRYVIDEICRNVDSGTSSTYFYKDSDSVDGKLYSGPLWDYDLAFGNYSKYSDPEGFEAKTRYYFGRLMEFDVFSDEVIRQYERVMPAFVQLAEHGIDDYAAKIHKSALMNFTRYSNVFGIKHGIVSPVKAGESMQGAIDYVRNFLKARIKWTDKNLYNEYKRD